MLAPLRLGGASRFLRAPHETDARKKSGPRP
jgi:hypothetical protein